LKRKMEIKTEVSEKELMEGLLNQYHAGYQVDFIFVLYALANSWHIDKFNYYMKLIKGEQDV